MVHRIKGIVGQTRKRRFAIAADDDDGSTAVASRFGHAVQSARLTGVRDQHNNVARAQRKRKADRGFADGACHAAQTQLRKLKPRIKCYRVCIAHGGELDNAGILKRMYNSCQRIVVDAVDSRIKLAHFGGEDVLKALLHVVERDLVGQTLVALAFQVARQRKLKTAEAAKAQLAAKARNRRLGRGGGS